MFSIPCLKPDDPHAHPSPITASSSQLAYTGNVNGVYWDFPSGPVVKNPQANAADMGLIFGLWIKILQATGQLTQTSVP